MMKLALILLLGVGLSSCVNQEDSEPDYLGRFDRDKDLFLAHFDVKTDVDDVHSVAGVATMLADPRFFEVRYHAVAGTYGIQEGLYVPAERVTAWIFGFSDLADANDFFEEFSGSKRR